MAREALHALGRLLVEPVELPDGSTAFALVSRLDGSSVAITGPVTVSNEVEIKNQTGNAVPVRVAAALVFPAAIAVGESLSAAVALDGAAPVRIVVPAGFTGAALEVQASHDGAAFSDLYDAYGSKVRLTVAAGTAVRLTVADWLGIKALKLRAATAAGVAQAQAGAVSLSVVAVP